MAARAKRGELEVVWRGSPSFGACADVLAHNYFTGNYGPPDAGDFFFEFRYDWKTIAQPIVDDDSGHNNVKQKVDLFVRTIEEWSKAYPGRDVLMLMGNDFTYTSAMSWFRNLDRLIHYVNKDGRINLLYSTPSKYVEAKKAHTQEPFALKGDDFFPYADLEHAYWTGYFTTRATKKHYTRVMASYLQAVRQAQAYAHLYGMTTEQYAGGPVVGSIEGGDLDALDEAVALLQHHDAITGTEKQAVVGDYVRRLYNGWTRAAPVMAHSLLRLMFGK
eukprot:CAMPEP_0202881492 /NCGR_PEP_ID=MMETSP1391-20130828/36615_1 /ASSEMBLY_ACC=CAM_ASM_000867 /TAXON_ID=1034604 /ORGANISM="Chlamydomonas leiostraca, Strain SAG 11-49" /LENGTH=274 /DNA_ID=CAMNT_0049564191 /DNA_START=36 /DNA_END=857 /DNA_ORIENTATION=+